MTVKTDTHSRLYRMGNADDERNAHEAEIAKATCGADYSLHLGDLSKQKQEDQKRKAARAEYVTQQRHGHSVAVERGERRGRYIEPGG